MDFNQPEGRIIVNSKVGFTGKIKEIERNSYVFPDVEVCSADELRSYRVGNGENDVIYINQYEEILRTLEEIDF